MANGNSALAGLAERLLFERLVEAVTDHLRLKAGDVMREDQEVALLAGAVFHMIAQQPRVTDAIMGAGATEGNRRRRPNRTGVRRLLIGSGPSLLAADRSDGLGHKLRRGLLA